MKWDSETQQWAIGIGVVVILALGGWWFFTSAPADTESTDTKTATSTNTGTTSSSSDGRPTVEVNMGEEVHVNDQPAGDNVRVVEARLSRVSWLAVRDTLRILGAGKVTPPEGGGTMTDITIPLLRNTAAGTTYTVVVYADDGDGVFDFKKDALVSGLDDTFSAIHGD